MGFVRQPTRGAALLLHHHPLVVSLRVGHIRLPPPGASANLTTPPARPPPGIQSSLSSDVDDGLAGFCRVDCPVQLRVDEAPTGYPDDGADWFDAWRGEQSSLATREAALYAHHRPRREPVPTHSPPVERPFTESALRPSHDNHRCTDGLPILSLNPGPARGNDPSALASNLTGPWHVVCVQEGAGLVTDRSLAENFHVVTRHHCAVLLNKTPSRTCTRALPSKFPAHTGIPPGPSRVWLKRANSGDLLTRRVSTSLWQLFS